MRRLLATSGMVATCLALFAVAFSADAGEVPQAVKDACSGDYQQLCSKHKPESDAARDCMADAFSQLSDGCVTAILSSDLVDEQADKQAAPAKQETDVAEKTAQPHRKVAKARKVKRNKRVARVHRKRVARHRRAPHAKKVVRYMKRGVRIAKFYVSKAFAKAFH